MHDQRIRTVVMWEDEDCDCRPITRKVPRGDGDYDFIIDCGHPATA